MGTAAEERNRAFVLEAFDTLVNRRDYVVAQRFWSPDYVQHSAHIPPGLEGLFNLVEASPSDRRYENALTVADGDYVMLHSRDGDYVMLHSRLSTTGPEPNRITVDIVRLQDGLMAEHWDVVQDEAIANESKSGLPMFGDTFPTRA
jgi:predicted SnoaL-like aldol condensation-catalyzing enzyme